MTSLEIIAQRAYRTPVALTSPVDNKKGMVGTVTYIKWNDGIITVTYNYPDGTSQILLVDDPNYFERECKPNWITFE